MKIYLPVVKTVQLYILFLLIGLIHIYFALSGSYFDPPFLFAKYHASLWSVSVCIFLLTFFRLYHIITFTAIYRHVLACLCLYSGAGLLPYKAEFRSKTLPSFCSFVRKQLGVLLRIYDVTAVYSSCLIPAFI